MNSFRRTLRHVWNGSIVGEDILFLMEEDEKKEYEESGGNIIKSNGSRLFFSGKEFEANMGQGMLIGPLFASQLFFSSLFFFFFLFSIFFSPLKLTKVVESH